MPHMLKDLFGGDTMVENVKIVPDRNVSLSLIYYLELMEIVKSRWTRLRFRYDGLSRSC